MKKTDYELVRLGSAYGGYWVPVGLLANPSSAGFISAGLGRDISLDLALLECGLPGIGIDPIQDYISDAFLSVSIAGLSDKYELICGALTPRGEDLLLFPPEKGDSWRNTPSTKSQESMPGSTFPGVDLPKVITHFGTETQNIVIKMDIEGVELEIINSVSSLDERVKYFIIEFDALSQIPFRKVSKRIGAVLQARKSIKHLKSQSFDLIRIEEFNFAFIRI